MEKPEKSPETGGNEPKPARRGTSTWLIIVAILVATVLLFSNKSQPRTEISYSFFWNQLDRGNVEYIQTTGNRVLGRFKVTPDAIRF